MVSTPTTEDEMKEQYFTITLLAAFPRTEEDEEKLTFALETAVLEAVTKLSGRVVNDVCITPIG